MSDWNAPSLSLRAKPLAYLVFGIVLLGMLATVMPVSRSHSGERSSIHSLSRVDSSCTADITTTLKPASRRLCDPVDITTTIDTACTTCPDGLNVVFIQDDTPYPNWQRMVSLQALDELIRYARKGRSASVGVIHYNGRSVRKVLNPTLNLSAARGPLQSFNVAHDPRALFMEAARAGVQMVRSGRRLHGDSATRECEFVIFFVYTKVYMNDKGQEMIQAGRTLLREVDNLYVGCPHQHPEECTIWEPQVPESRRYYTEDPEGSKLRNMVQRRLRDIDTKGFVTVRSMTTDQWLPSGLAVVPGSFSIVPKKSFTEGTDTRMTWDWRLPASGYPVSVTFQAKPQTAGVWQSELEAKWTDSQQRRGERKVVSVPVTVLDDDCSTPTPMPTPTATPPPTITPTPMDTATTTATPPPTATSTPRTWRIYLPLLVREECVTGEVHADVVLVIDVSTSMNRLSRTGRTKLAATQDAAKDFVRLMDLNAGVRGGHDQVAVVGFNKVAWIEASLGTGTARILQAIDDLPGRQAEYTRLDLALTVGAEAILEGARRPGNTPVIVLLTDGLPNQVPYAEDGKMETTVLRAAAAAKEAGITVFTIAIGAPEDTNPVLLKGCASTEDHYYYTPDPEDLAGIYRAIAHVIDCPPDAFWGQR